MHHAGKRMTMQDWPPGVLKEMQMDEPRRTFCSSEHFMTIVEEESPALASFGMPWNTTLVRVCPAGTAGTAHHAVNGQIFRLQSQVWQL